MVHSRKLTWQWKITILNRRYIFKWLFFHCHVSFQGCNQSSTLLVCLVLWGLNLFRITCSERKFYDASSEFWFEWLLGWIVRKFSHKINLDKDLSSIHLPYRHRYWKTNLQSMLHCLIKDHFPKKKDSIQWCFSAHLQFCFHEVPTNTGDRFTILHNHPTESPEAQIGPLLSEYLLRSSLVDWAKAPPTSSSKSQGHVPGQQWNPNMPNKQPQQKEWRERERASFSN